MNTTDPVADGYRFLRSEVQFQHSQIGVRTSGYVTSQSFLFVAAMMSLPYKVNGLYLFSGLLLPVVGLSLSLLAARAVSTAVKRLGELRAAETKFAETPWYMPVSEELTRQSLLFARWTPWIIACFWVLMIVLLPIVNLVRAV